MSNEIKVEMGSNVFYKGKKYKLIGMQQDCSGLTAVLMDESIPAHSWVGIEVPAAAVEPLAEDVFNIGAPVVSVYGQFVGRVMDFERSTNRIVCKSDRDEESDRKRYAYKIREIRVDNKPAFERNRRYKVDTMHQKELHVKALVHPDRDDLLVLYGTNDGKAITTVPNDLVKSEIGLYGFTKIHN